MAGTKISPVVLCTVALTLGWLAVTANAFHHLGRPLPLEQLVIALALLIVVSFLVGQVWIQRGPAYYRAMKLGEALGEEKARRRAQRSGDHRRMEATTG